MTTLTEENQEVQEVQSPTILRTRRDGVWEVYDGPWGSYLREADDPDANVEISDKHLEEFQLREDIHRIPADLWTKWVKLCFYFVDKVQDTVEVSTRILRSSEDPSKYRFLIPYQKVSAASVRAEDFDVSIDLETGEEITQYPPDGWIPVGSSHSHNTMEAFFSSIDDKYELNDPGIHIVVGSIDTINMKYRIAASIVGSRRRFEVQFDKLIDASACPGVEFHPDVINYVDFTKPTIKAVTWSKKVSTSTYSNSQYSNPKNWGWGDDYKDYENDPFYWSNSYNSNHKVNCWNIVDSLNDYLEEHKDNAMLLYKLKDELEGFVTDLDAYLEVESEDLMSNVV
jgi:hypothetical protein